MHYALQGTHPGKNDMASMRWIVWAAGLVSLAGCGHSHPDQTATAIPKSLSLEAPTDPNDVNAWRAFMTKTVLEVTHDKTIHPYSFVVPPGDAPDAMTRRQSEAMTIHRMLGHTAVPDNMIALTGPDSGKVAEVVATAFKGVPARTTQGLIVLFIGKTAAAPSVKDAVSAAGAQLQVRDLHAP